MLFIATFFLWQILPLGCMQSTRPPVRLSFRRCELAVEAQEVVHGEIEFRDGWLVLQGRVRAVPVVTVKPGLEMIGAVGGVRVDGGVSPFG